MPKDRMGDNEDLNEEAADAMVNTIHRGFANGRDTMVVRRKCVREVEVAKIKTFDPKFLDQPNIIKEV